MTVLNDGMSAQTLLECRAHIPALKNKNYFNFGGQGTMPQSVLDAIFAAYHHVQTRGPFSAEIFEWIADELAKTRAALATEFGGMPSSYVLTQNSTEGCNIVVWGMDWQPGDVILLTDSEHPSLVELAETLARRKGVRVDYLKVVDASEDQVLERLRQALKQRPRLFAFSNILWNTGAVLPLGHITELCHSNGVPVLVDGAQSAGSMPLDLVALAVDYFAFTGHKWICGPEGLGALYINRDHLSHLQQTFVGWRAAGMLPGEHGPDASRYEVATSAFPLLSGLREALRFHSIWGATAERYQRIGRNAARLYERLSAIGKYDLILPSPSASGLVSFRSKSTEQKHAAIAAKCEQAKCLLRTVHYPSCLRASVHYFTSDEEIDTLVNIL